jgi:hypothetical protein
LKFVATLCLVLTVSSALGFATHHHSNRIDAAKCSVCAVAHSAAPKAAVRLLNATFTPVSVFVAKSFSAKQRFAAFALSVRPPPTV